MNLLRTYVLGMVAAISGVFQINASTFDARKLKDLWSIFKSDYQNISPIQGALCCSTKFLDNFYKWGPVEWPTHALLNDLFHPLSEGTVRLSQLASNGALSLNGELVGRIVVMLKRGASEEESDTLVADWRKSSKGKLRIVDGKRKLALIKQSYEYDPIVTLALLTSVLYLQSTAEGGNPKKKMIDYVRALWEGLSDEPFVQPITEDYLESMQDSCYTDEELFRGAVSEESVKIGVSLLKIGKRALSPKIIQRSYGFNGQKSRPNCAETALMDFFCILFFDPSTKTFTFNNLPVHIQESLNDRLRTFFIRNNDAHKVNDTAVQREWMDAVSGIDGFKSDAYVTGTIEKGRYEVESDVENLFAFINYLLGTRAADWIELGNLLSTDENQIMCKIQKTDDNNSIIIINSGKSGLIEIHVVNNCHTYLLYKIRDVDSVKLQIQLFNENNNHNFYTNRLEDCNDGLRALEEMFEYYRDEFPSFEGVIRTCDIVFALIKKGYFGNDSYFYEKTLELVMQNSLEDQELFTHFTNAVFESGKVAPLVLINSVRKFYKNFELRKKFYKIIIKQLPKDLLKKREDGGSLFVDYMKKYDYEIALLLTKEGADISGYNNDQTAALFIVGQIVLLPVDDAIGLLSFDCVDKNAIDDIGRSIWHCFCLNIVNWHEQPQLGEYMLEATAQGVITTINSVETRKNQTPLDFLIVRKEEQKMFMSLGYITKEQAAEIDSYIDDFILKMRKLGAKTAQELGV